MARRRELLASGGNDNVVNIWDGRLGDVVEGSRGTAKWTKRNHTAAVKVSNPETTWANVAHPRHPCLQAIAWCRGNHPSCERWGTNDATINVWNSTTGARLHSLKTPSQVTSVQWSPHKKEILTTHGYPNNSSWCTHTLF